jgi:glutamyl-tRNA synthetase
MLNYYKRNQKYMQQKRGKFMVTNLDLANLIFPDIHESIADLEKRYPERILPEGAKVTRFAPSPTGFLHTGSLFTAFIGYKLALDSNGVFFFRLEDTDTKREIAGSDKELLEQLALFNIKPMEGCTVNGEVGNYGPYCQSDREVIYKTVIKEMIVNGLAYPCFCSKEDLDALREEQEKEGVIPGYYGKYAKCRNLSVEEAYNKIKNGESYVIRFRSQGDHTKYIKVHDEIRGDLELSQNDQDIVILKSDNLPTYHFAHACDDHFMRTTLVTRGEEWISSLPIHIELFDALHFKRVKYAHLPVIMKLDENGNKRKLSKRKDNEAAVSYFLKDGYPTEAILTYLMSIANSNFEEFLIANKGKTYHDFAFSLKKMSLDGALFDIEKLKYFSKEYLAKLNKDEFTALALEYAKNYDEPLLNLINRDIEHFKNIINIERERPNPRKDYSCFKELYEGLKIFYHDEFLKLNFEFNPKLSKEQLVSILKDMKNVSFKEDESAWFNAMKALGEKYNYASDNKAYKLNPENYLGNMSDFTEILRIALTSRKQTPNLFMCLNVLGLEEVNSRLDYIVDSLSK